jgi:quinol monooxygenase YgiN
MVTRLVKITVEPGKLELFMNIFDKVKDTIASFDGCHHVELLQDIHSQHIFFTYSIWEDEHYLNSYRFSEFFKRTWEESKKLFAAKAEAWSVSVVAKAQSDHF